MSKLIPTIVTEATIGDAAFSGQRSRPVLATMKDGSTVVCCRSTARRHGWTVEGKLYAKPKAPKLPKAEQRKADLKAVEDLLGTPSLLAQVNADVAKAGKATKSVLDVLNAHAAKKAAK